MTGGRHTAFPVGPGDWVDRAECGRVGVDMAISNTTAQTVTSPAAESRKAICRVCPVITECRRWALTDPDPAFMHIAGGLHPAERSRLRRERRAR